MESILRQDNLLRGIVEKAVGSLVQLIYPLRCPVCDDIVIPYGRKICPECVKKLKYVESPRCLKCGKKLEEAEQEYCLDCSKRQHFFVQGRALYEYGSVAGSIYRFKYGNRQEYASFYGEEVARNLGEFIHKIRPDGLIPVPLHRVRQRKRGYNQAQLLAKAISHCTGVPVYDKIVTRKRNTLPLKQLNPRERQNNLKKAFIIRGNDVKLKTILIIDDIFTTGSTIDELSRVLLAAGAEKIYFITLACGSDL